MFSKYIKYTNGTIIFFLKSPFSLCKKIRNIRHLEWRHLSFDVTSGTSEVSFYNRVRYEGVFSIAVVCRSRHDFFTYSWLQYIKFFHNGKTLCRPVLYWFKQNWASNANISKWRKFEATICEICSSENSRFRRAVRTFCYLYQSFFFLVLYRRFRPYQKQIIRKYKNDPYSR